MPKNNSKARKSWRKQNIVAYKDARRKSPEERLLMAIFGVSFRFPPKPGTDAV